MNTEGSLLSRMAQLLNARAGSYFVAAFCPGGVGAALMTGLFVFILGNTRPGATDPLTLWRSLSASGKLLVIAGMIFGLWTPVLVAARGVCRITASLLANQPTSLAATLADMAAFVPAALVYSVLIGLPSMIGSSMLYLPGLCILSLFTQVIPAGVIESKGAFAALNRGLSLGTKVFGRSLLLVLGSAVLLLLAVMFRAVLLDRFVSGSTTLVLAFRYALMYMPALVLLILANICFTLLFVEARDKETLPRPMSAHG